MISTAKKLTFTFLLFIISTSSVFSVNKTASISINPRNSHNIINKNQLFGVFIEYLRDYVNGPCGLYAQELLDRGFDVSSSNTNIGVVWVDSTYPAGNIRPWLIYGGVNPNGLTCKRLVSMIPEGFTQTQQNFYYTDTVSYSCYFYYQSDYLEGTAEVLVMSGDGSKELMRIELPKSIGVWKKFEFNIPAGLPYTNLNITFRVSGKAELNIDEASCRPDNHILGIRSEWYQLLKDLKPGIFRYPGGCFADLPAANFKHSIGPIDSRKSPNLDYGWQFLRMDFGTDEFLTLCEDLEIEPHLTLNYQNGTVEQAMQWVRYCNADTNDYWGKQRKNNGRAEPYNVKYFEVGNEQWDKPSEYAHNYIEYYDSLKAFDSNIKVIIDGNNWPGDAYFDTLYQIAGDKIEIYAYHPCVTINDTYTNTLENTYKAALGASSWNFMINDVQKSINKRQLENSTVQAVSEWWSFWANMGNWTQDTSANNSTLLMGIANAGVGISLLKHGSMIEFADRTLGINFIKRGFDKNTGKRSIFGDLSYISMKMLSQHSGNKGLDCITDSEVYTFYPPNAGLPGFENVPYIEVAATSDDDSIYVAIINRYISDSAECYINLLNIYKTAKIYELYSPNLLDRNTFENPNNIIEKVYQLETKSKNLLLPPHSLTIIALALKDSIESDIITHLLHPNPNNGTFTISLNSVNQLSDLKIFNTNGNQISCSYILFAKDVRINCSELSNGVYYGQLYYGNRVKSFTFVIQK